MFADEIHSCIFLEINFLVKGGKPLLTEKCRSHLLTCITSLVAAPDQKLISLICLPDEVFLFVRMSPKVTLTGLIRNIKSASSRMLNKKGLLKEKFRWEHGYEAFSHSHANLYSAIKEIQEVVEFRSAESFEESYYALLRSNGISFNENEDFESL